MKNLVNLPKNYFFVSGEAEGNTKLNSFDNALFRAGIGNYNLLKVSSIVPPNCEEKIISNIPFGTILPIAYTFLSSNVKGREIASAISVGIPQDINKPGVIMEYSDFKTFNKVKKILEEMTYEALLYRGYKVKKIKIEGEYHIVKKIATTFAGVVFWV